MTRPIPMLDDIELDAVHRASHVTTQHVASMAVIGLAGDAQQRLSRASHEIELAGVIVGDGARDALSKLQKKAATGEEVTFTADITSALDLEKVVVVRAEFVEEAAVPDRYQYRLFIRESPPLPPPAELSPFGGLDGFDLGFDTDVLGDISSLADQVQNAVEQVAGAVNTLQQLASLGDLGLNNPVQPLEDEASKLGSVGSAGVQAADALKKLFGGG